MRSSSTSTASGERFQTIFAIPFSTSAFAMGSFGAVASYWKGWPTSALFPAASWHAPTAAAFATSGPLYRVGAVHAAIPDVASVPAKLKVTGFRYQPLLSGLRSGDGVTAGGVASYLNPTLAGALAFPATSVQVPESEADALSPPPYVGAAAARDSRDGVLAAEGGRDRVVEPAVRVRGARERRAADAGRGLVDPDRHAGLVTSTPPVYVARTGAVVTPSAVISSAAGHQAPEIARVDQST